MIEKLIEQQETIKGMQENEDSAIKIMKMYEDYKLRVDKAIEYIENLENSEEINVYQEDKSWVYVLQILKGEDKE